ncbi:hypothetical protein PM082_003235 [Marasmius tenuissimus]|nr:hypothetical protein PM082_003235 [Marasmius tenuissimus]
MINGQAQQPLITESFTDPAPAASASLRLACCPQQSFMPSRKKPTSTRKKKEEQQLRRAIKRGDVEAPPPKRREKNKKRPPNARSTLNPATESSQKLQSSFVKISAAFLKKSQELASTLPLQRPIPAEASIYQNQWTKGGEEQLTCPSRPKWNYEMTKKEVEHNEEGWFKKWLKTTDELVSKWQMSMEPDDPESPEKGKEVATSERPPTMPPSPTRFERNLEVWRQLWRVTEISQIVLVLLDSRCPTVHLPPSLVQYLSKQQVEVILVLTKTDICGPARVAAWRDYLHELYPQFPIVQVQSYAPREQTSVHQGSTQFEPYLPPSFREQLVNTIREVHTRMLEPPANVKSRPAALQHWRPLVKREINWEDALVAGEEAGKIIGGPAAPKPLTEESDKDEEPPFLTIGLIGQPNVGKSSLLNALFGQSRVRASKTPGKTKHYQTLFWTSDIRLVDCPGLVMPNYTPMEMQVLSGVLPIARLSAISACAYFASQLLPLERIFNLTHPSALEPPEEDKRTWREGMKRPEPKPISWTAMDVLVAYANKKGWFTAQAGRPDINRAGNAILRALAENRVPWAFWPTGIAEDGLQGEGGEGLWMSQGYEETLSDEEASSEGEDTLAENASEDGDSEDNEDDIDESSDSVTEAGDIASDDLHEAQSSMKVGAGRFALLNLADDSEEEHDSN